MSAATRRALRAPPHLAESLTVWSDGRSVGTLRRQGDAGLRFAYDPGWLADDRSFAISRSLPLRPEPFDGAAARFFGNLLPEGGVRSSVCRRLGIAEDSDFSLLAMIGRECAGALEIVAGTAAPAAGDAYRPLDDARLERWLESADVYGGAIADDVRLSLAGAQDKIGVRVEGDALYLPGPGAATTHLLKLPNRDFAALPQNEALVLELARRVGLPAVSSRLLTHLSRPVLLVSRYDRTPGTPPGRLHQEDFCQALGVDRRRKYEIDGGPSFAACVELIREVSVDPLRDVRTLLGWLAFGVVVGNRDGHAKNLALLADAAGRWALAPLYDLVCTTAYPRLSRRLAMAVGDRGDGRNLPAAAWREQAVRIDVTPRYLVELVEGIAVRVGEVLAPAIDALAEQLGSDAHLVGVRRAIRKGVRTTLAGLRQ